MKLKENVEKRAKKYLKSLGVKDLSLIDLEGYWDSSLNYWKNIENIKETYGLESKKTKQEKIDEIKSFKDKQEKEEYEKVKKAFNKALTNLPDETSKVKEVFNSVKEYSQIMVESDKIYGLIILGDAGIGKSFQTLKAISEKGLEEGKDFVYFQSYTTPVELVNLLWDNRDDKIIILDDVEGLFKDSKAVNILKSVLWNSVGGQRFCEYHTTSSKLRSPSKFLFTSKIIIITNKINKNDDEHIMSLKSRCFVLKIELTFEEKIKLMYDIAKKVSSTLSPNERKGVVDYFKGKGVSVKNFDFRLLIKALFLREKKPESWKKLVDEMLEIDELMLYAIQIMDETTSVRNERWVENTGYSVRTLRRVLNEVRKRIGEKNVKKRRA